jgi:hypothetical protein
MLKQFVVLAKHGERIQSALAIAKKHVVRMIIGQQIHYIAHAIRLWTLINVVQQELGFRNPSNTVAQKVI